MTNKTFTTEYQTLLQLQSGEKPALIASDETITFGMLRDRIDQYRQGLRALGVQPGDRVSVCFPNSPEVLYIAFALCDIGACLVPIHPATPPPFMARILGFLQVTRLIVPDGSPLAHAELPCPVWSLSAITSAPPGDKSLPAPPGPEATAVIISTSGTTAEPKFVPISQENFATIIDSTRALVEPVSAFDEGCAYIMVFPLSSSGILPTMAQIVLGSTYVLTDDVSPNHFLSLIQEHRLDGLQGPPAYLEGLVQFPAFDRFDVSSITRINSGSDFVSNNLLLALKKRFINLTHVGIGYGLAETSAIVMSWNAHSEADLKRPTNRFQIINHEDNEVMIHGDSVPLPPGEKGEICIRGKSVISAYLQNPALTEQAFDADGWFHTGDVGRITEDGAVELLGRNKFTIKRGGRSIAPVTVSSALEEHPDVAVAAVVGVPHPLFGEMVWAFVKAAPGAALSEGDINAFCRENLPAYLKPDNIVFSDAIPKTRVGKTDYQTLRQIGIERLKEMTGDEHE